MLGAASAFLKDGDYAVLETKFDRLRSILREQRHVYRERMVSAAAQQRISTYDTLRKLDSARWLHRVAYHIWRILHHIRRAEEDIPATPPSLEIAVELEDEGGV